MPRFLKVAAAQMGPNQEGTPREAIVERMLTLLDLAARDGVELIAGSCIIDPQGQILARAATRGDELIVARIDFDQMVPLRKRWNFLGRRQPQHDGEMLKPVTEKEPHR